MAALLAAPSGASKNVGTGVCIGWSEFLIVRLFSAEDGFFCELEERLPEPFFGFPLPPISPPPAAVEPDAMKPSSLEEPRHLLVRDLRFEAGVPARSETVAYGDCVVGEDGRGIEAAAATTAVGEP